MSIGSKIVPKNIYHFCNLETAWLEAGKDDSHAECICTGYIRENCLWPTGELTFCFPPISSKDKKWYYIYLDLQPWRSSNASTNFSSGTFVQVITNLQLLENKHDISNLFAKQRKSFREGALQQNDRWTNHLLLDSRILKKNMAFIKIYIVMEQTI